MFRDSQCTHLDEYLDQHVIKWHSNVHKFLHKKLFKTEHRINDMIPIIPAIWLDFEV